MSIDEIRDKMFDCMCHNIKWKDKKGDIHKAYAEGYTNEWDDPDGKAYLETFSKKDGYIYGLLRDEDIEDIEIID